MVLVTIFGAYILIKQEYKFETLEMANNFLSDKGYSFDEVDNEEEIHYWHLDENTFALIERC